MSLLEAVAWWAGEPHSDHPACVSPVLAAFGRGWADALDDDRRQQLKAWVPKLVGTGGDGGDDRRVLLLVDWLARTCAPAFLRAAGLTLEAERLEGAAEVTGWEPAARLGPPGRQAAAAAWVQLEAAWVVRPGAKDAPQAAHQATQAAAASAAGAWVAAGVLSRPASRDLNEALVAALAAAVAGASMDAHLVQVRTLALRGVQAAASEAVDAAALTAALHAPPDAAWAMLRPTVRQLQDGAFDLLERLCAAGKVAV